MLSTQRSRGNPLPAPDSASYHIDIVPRHQLDLLGRIYCVTAQEFELQVRILSASEYDDAMMLEIFW
jgi:hypothetical protein